MDLHYLRLFDAVAYYESFTKASKHIGISQSALSIQIKRFEQDLGMTLFNRIGNRVSLNENGKILFKYTQEIFGLVAQADYALQHNFNIMGGTINIGASNTPGTYIFPEVIAEYRRLYPNVSVNLNIGNTSEIAHHISNGSLDFALNGGNMEYRKEIYAEKLMDDELVLIACPNSEYANLPSLDVETLAKLEFVVHKTDSQLYFYYKSFIDSRNIPERVSISLGNIDAIKHAIMAGIGVSLVPYVSVALELQNGLLARLSYEGSKPSYPYSLIYNKNKFITPPAEKFMELLRKWIEEGSYVL